VKSSTYQDMRQWTSAKMYPLKSTLYLITTVEMLEYGH
jgi:hypothetical protein